MTWQCMNLVIRNCDIANIKWTKQGRQSAAQVSFILHYLSYITEWGIAKLEVKSCWVPERFTEPEFCSLSLGSGAQVHYQNW